MNIVIGRGKTLQLNIVQYIIDCLSHAVVSHNIMYLHIKYSTWMSRKRLALGSMVTLSSAATKYRNVHGPIRFSQRTDSTPACIMRLIHCMPTINVNHTSGNQFRVYNHSCAVWL